MKQKIMMWAMIGSLLAGCVTGCGSGSAQAVTDSTIPDSVSVAEAVDENTITDKDIEGFIYAEDLHVLQDTKDIIPEKTVMADRNIVKGVVVNDDKVNTHTVGNYDIEYKFVIDEKEYRKVIEAKEYKADFGPIEVVGEELVGSGSQVVVVSRAVAVVNRTTASKLANKGVTVYTEGTAPLYPTDTSAVTATYLNAKAEQWFRKTYTIHVTKPAVEGPPPTRPPKPTETVVPTATPTQKPTSTPTPTATPRPTVTPRPTTVPPTPTDVPQPTATPKPTHTHNWEPVTKTVHHDAEYKTVHHDAVLIHHDAEYKTVHHDAEIVHHDAVYEEKEVEHEICEACGADYGKMSREERIAHRYNHAINGENTGSHTEYSYETVKVKDAWDETVTEKVWVVDKPEHYEYEPGWRDGDRPTSL